jgi:hypothetical protein
MNTYIEADHDPETDALGGVGDEPEQEGDEGYVEEDERAAGRLVGQRAQDEEQPPLTLVNGVEFVRHQRREGEVKENVGHDVCILLRAAVPKMEKRPARVG